MTRIPIQGIDSERSPTVTLLTMAARVVGVAVIVLGMVSCKWQMTGPPGPNWEKLGKVSPPAEAIEVAAAGPSSVSVGQTPEFSVHSNHSGKLWVIQVDSKDRTTMLYPSSATMDNHIATDTVVNLPPAGKQWVAEKPVGATMVAFIVTSGANDLSSVLTVQNGNIQLAKGLGAAGTAAPWGIARLSFTIGSASALSTQAGQQ